VTKNEPKTTAVGRRLTAAQRADEALRMRLRRHTYREIATALGYSSPGNAYRAVEREIAKVPRENAKQLLAQELETLDAAQARLMPLVHDRKTPDLWAVDRVLAIMDRRARLMNLYSIPDTSGVDEFRDVLKVWRASIIAEVEDEEATARNRVQDTEGEGTQQ